MSVSITVDFVNVKPMDVLLVPDYGGENMWGEGLETEEFDERGVRIDWGSREMY